MESTFCHAPRAPTRLTTSLLRAMYEVDFASDHVSPRKRPITNHDWRDKCPAGHICGLNDCRKGCMYSMVDFHSRLGHFRRNHRGKDNHLRRELLVHHFDNITSYTPKMDPERKPDAASTDAQASVKRDRPASPAPAEINEEDAVNDVNPPKKPRFEKKSKKDYKPKSPYPGRGKNYDRPQLSEEERKAKAEERERLRVERRIADEERLENRDEGDRRLPKRRCALLMGYVLWIAH